jgi:hypothetical protein
MDFTGNHERLIGALIIMAMLSVLITSSETGAINTNQSIYPINAKPYGLTYGEWTAKWWQWSFSIPSKDNPVVDETGEKCSMGQNDTNVWLLLVQEEVKLPVLVLYLPGKPFCFQLLM